MKTLRKTIIKFAKFNCYLNYKNYSDYKTLGFDFNLMILIKKLRLPSNQTLDKISFNQNEYRFFV